MNRPYDHRINSMPKSLRTFLDDMRRVYPSEVVSITKTVNPLRYDITAIVKHLGALQYSDSYAKKTRAYGIW